MNAFLPADILFPQVDSMEKWAVIACDQFTSDPAYWERVRQHAEGSPSTINLILPEAELGTPQEAAHTALINRTMAEYLDANVFRTLKDSFVYVERTLENGTVRDDEDLKDFNRTVVKLGEELGKPVCATGDVHFLDPEDEVYRHILLASKKFADANEPVPLYFRTTDVTGTIKLPEGVEMVMPGDNVTITADLIHPVAMEEGLRFAIREGGRTVGSGVVTKINE